MNKKELNQSPVVKSKFELDLLKIKVILQLLKLFHRKSGNIYKTLKLVNQIRKKYQSTFGEPLLSKATKIDKRYYWRLGTPGFPSEATFKMHDFETNRFFPLQTQMGMRNIVFAITKKCYMRCEHCFEWGNLNSEDTLSTSDIIQIVHKFQDFGTTQIMFSGGEPLLRINDLYEILKSAKSGTDFWVITSGLGMDSEKASQLKKAGLTGLMVSIDHHEAAKHDKFRGYEGAFQLAQNAIEYANKAGLITAISICATKSFISEINLNAFMDMAKSKGVSFVQILDPRASGKYSGENVELGKEEIQVLEKAYLEYNSLKKYKNYPIINYLGYHQRRVGCFGSGNRFFYIDTDGDAHICPYCVNKVINTLRVPANETVDLLLKHSCHVFEKSMV